MGPDLPKPEQPEKEHLCYTRISMVTQQHSVDSGQLYSGHTHPSSAKQWPRCTEVSRNLVGGGSQRK